MPGIKMLDGTLVDIGVLLDAEGRLIASPPDTTFVTEFQTLVTDTDIMASGDVLATKSSFTGLPPKGVIHSIIISDAAKQSINLDVYFFDQDIVATAINAQFDPTDVEIKTCQGVVLVDTWKANNDNSIGSVDNIGLPYSVPDGELFFQLVTRGTPTSALAGDLSIRLGIIL